MTTHRASATPVGAIAAGSDTLISEALRRGCLLPVVEAAERMEIASGRIHVAPPDYHLLIEPDGVFALSADDKVNNARPAIDPTFESAAETWGDALVAVLLSGANADGARGMATVKAAGGFCLVQDPATAEEPTMPEAAMALGAAHWVAPPEALGGMLVSLCPSRSRTPCP